MTSETGILDTFRPAPVLPMNESLQAVERAFGVPLFQQISEIVSIGIAGRRFSPEEYYKLGVFAAEGDAKKAFLGAKNGQRQNARLSHPQLVQNRRIVDAKVFHAILLEQMGLSVPKTLAQLHPEQMIGGIEPLRSADDVARFLRESDGFPIFGKPTDASLSLGVVSMKRFDAETDELVLLSGDRVPVTEFAGEVVEKYGTTGYLFQSRIAQHPEIVEACGDAVGTVRIVTLREAVEADVLYALWKIPGGQAAADNFWRSGNMIAHVDAESGTVLRVQQGIGGLQTEITDHPVTGALLVGRTLPNWPATKAAAIKAAQLTPDLRIIGWDIAMGADGPVIIEGNGNPHHDLYQIAARTGLLSPDFAARFDRIEADNLAEIARRQAVAKTMTREARRQERSAMLDSMDLKKAVRTKASAD